MIRYALICADCEAEFDAWFNSSAGYDEQCASGSLSCPECASSRIGKQIMAPAVRGTKRKSDQPPSPSRTDVIKAAQDYIAATHDYVGTDFPDEARAMYYGEAEERPIWGEASADEQAALKEEGVGAIPLPAALAPKKPKKISEMN